MNRYVVERALRTRALAGLGFTLLAFIVGTVQVALLQTDAVEAAPRQGERPAELVQRVSLGRIGVEGDSDSFRPSISADGQFVVFLSTAENLVEADSNGLQDVFLFDRAKKLVTRISVAHDGGEANGASSDARISSDGRFVAFVSEASNLVATDTNGYADVFLYDVESGQTRLVSMAANGTQGDDRSVQPSISGDGRFVAFVSLADSLHENDSNGVSDVYIYNRDEGNLELISVADDGAQADHHSKHAAISDDGRYVAFQSMATNLVDADDDQLWDIYLRDRLKAGTELISRNLEGRAGSMDSQRPALSADGRYVVFESWADDLVADDHNFFSDVFVMDRHTGAIELASVANDGRQADDVNGGAAISADGRYVAFSSMAGNLVDNDYNQMFDVYVRDRYKGRTQLISVNVDGQAGGGVSISPALTAAGTFIVFDSGAEDLVLNDTNRRIDVFVFNTPESEPAQYHVHLPLLLTP